MTFAQVRVIFLSTSAGRRRAAPDARKRRQAPEAAWMAADMPNGEQHIADDLRREFGGRLRRLREEAGLSLRALGAEVGLGTSALSDLELGKGRRPPDGARIRRILTVCLRRIGVDRAVSNERERRVLRDYTALVSVLETVGDRPRMTIARPGPHVARPSGAADGAIDTPQRPWVRVRLIFEPRTSAVTARDIEAGLTGEGCRVRMWPTGTVQLDAPATSDGTVADVDLFLLNDTAATDAGMIEEIVASAARLVAGIPVYESPVVVNGAGAPAALLALIRGRGVHLSGGSTTKTHPDAIKELVRIVCHSYLNGARSQELPPVLSGPMPVIFIGPDLLPSSYRIRRRLEAVLAVSGSGRDDIELEYCELLQHFEYRFGRPYLLRQIAEAGEEEHDGLHSTLRQVLALPFRVVVVGMGIDLAMDAVLRAAGWQVICRPADVPAELSESKRYYVNLAGSLDGAGDAILTRSDIETRCHQIWGNCATLLTVLSTQSLLFLGHDVRSPDFRSLYTGLIAPLDRRGVHGYVVVDESVATMAAPFRPDEVTMLSADGDDVVGVLERIAAHRPTQRVVRAPGRVQGANRPYKFLDYYEEEDAEIYFGRELESRALLSKVLSSRLTLLYGVSGTGKTSLINAGLRPLAKAEGFDVVSARLVHDPVEVLRTAVRSCMTKAPDGEPGQRVDDRVTRHMVRHQVKLIIAVDQFEELFIHHGRETMVDFARELERLRANPYVPVKFLLSIREDYLPYVSELDPHVPDLFRSYLRLHPLTSAQALEAVVRPAQRYELAYERGLAERIVSDLTYEGVEPPQLQIVCDQLFDLAADGIIGTRAYERLGRVRGMLGNYTNDVVRRLPRARKSLAIDLLKYLVTAHGTKDSVTATTLGRRFRCPDEEIEEVIGFLIRDRLLRRVENVLGPTYELTHDYLAHEIRGWIAENEIQQKAALHLLGQELDTWKRHHTVMDVDRFRIVDEQRSHISRQLTDDEAAYALLCSLYHDRDVAAWLEINIGNPQTSRFLQGAIEGVGVRRSARQLCAFAVGYLRLDALIDQAVDVLRADGNPHLFERLEALAASGEPDLCDFRDRAVTAITARGRERMVHVDAGSFVAGTPLDEVQALIEHYSIDTERLNGEVPQRHERVDGFWIDRYPVTNADYHEFDADFTFPDGTDDHPAVNLNFGHAQAFAHWWGKELPTELEWERAARGDDGRRYPWGSDWDSGACNTDERRLGTSTPVDAFPNGISPHGCWDMGGNVWEWVDSWFDEKLRLKVCKGGGWAADRLWVRCAARHRSFVNSQFHLVGFRCVVRDGHGAGK